MPSVGHNGPEVRLDALRGAEGPPRRVSDPVPSALQGSDRSGNGQVSDGDPAGLVLCAITARGDHASGETSALERAWAPRFPAAWAVGQAAATLRAAVGGGDVDGQGRPLPVGGRWDGREGIRPRITVSPGAVTVSRFDPARAERAAERERHARDLDVAQLAAGLGRERRREAVRGFLGLSDADLDDLGLTSMAPPARRGRISEWSQGSRRRMVKRFSTLDYGPLVDHGRPLAMVTLTLPGDWQVVAGTRDQWNSLVRAWLERYARRWGHRLVALWKLEFQRRGAPHLHLLLAPETIDGVKEFRSWLSASWADVVAHPDPVQRMRHEAAGTAVDWNDGLRATDPKRVAVYFLKHGMLSGKEYQNTPPQEWLDDGNVGRFWGFYGLKPVEHVVEVTPAQADQAARTLRRWQAARHRRCGAPVRSDDGRTVVACNDCRARGVLDVLPAVRRAATVSVERCTLHTEEPVRGSAAFGQGGCRKCQRAGTLHGRAKSRRVRRMPGTWGWVSVNDGAAAALVLSALWAERPDRGPLP